MTKAKVQTLTPTEHQAIQQFLEALQRKDYRECRAAARAFLPKPPPLPADPEKRRAYLVKRIRVQLANAERDGSHVAAMRLLKMLVEVDGSVGDVTGPPTPDEAVEQMRMMPQLWREAGEGDELRDELEGLVAWWCERDDDMRAALQRAAGGE